MTAKEALDKLAELEALFHAGILTAGEYSERRAEFVTIARREIYGLRPLPAEAFEKPRPAKRSANA